jgi:hypothetical protein
VVSRIHLHFLTVRPNAPPCTRYNSTLAILCAPADGSATDRLLRPQEGELTTEFHIGAGEMVRLLRWTGFELVDLIELHAPEDAVDHPFYTGVGADWAKRWAAAAQTSISAEVVPARHHGDDEQSRSAPATQ